MDGRTNRGGTVSPAVTTCRAQSFYSHACLEVVREWKSCRNGLPAAGHDASHPDVAPPARADGAFELAGTDALRLKKRPTES